MVFMVADFTGAVDRHRRRPQVPHPAATSSMTIEPALTSPPTRRPTGQPARDGAELVRHVSICGFVKT